MRPIAITLLLLLLGASPAPRPDPFSPDRLHVIHLQVTPKGWEMMQPTHTRFWLKVFGIKPDAQTRPASRPAYVEGTPLRESPMGSQYAYVKATVDIDGQSMSNVGLRFKGNSSYWAGESGYRRPMKIDFERFVDGQRFAGMSELNLHNNAFDTSNMREILSYQLCREAGLPASRASYAAVYLTVDGKFKDKYIGLYTLVEEVDKSFLKSHYKSKSGLLMKPEGLWGGVGISGKTWKQWAEIYRPKRAASDAESRRIMEFGRLVQTSDEATFRREIRNYLDVDEFLRFIAMNALLANLDSYLTTGHNFYLYLDPSANKLSFIPWDLNLSFGIFSWVGTAQDQARLSVHHPYAGANRLIERVLKIDEYGRDYRRYVRQFSADMQRNDHFQHQVAAYEKLIREAAGLAAKSGQQMASNKMLPGASEEPFSIHKFMDLRLASVSSQLEKEEEGYVPKFQVAGIFGRPVPQKPAPQQTPPKNPGKPN